MTDPASYRPAPGQIPTDPGVYRFRDPHGRVIYVGKARNLRSRLNSYFSDPVSLHPRTRSMVTTAASVDWVVVANEVEALSLEYAWIKEYDPRFNVKYRDDKSYPYLAVTVSEEFPRAAVVREAKRKGSRYFGPYAHAWAIRETLDELIRVFPVRTCRDGVFRRAAQVGRPCLLGYIDKCSAPCVGRVSAEEYGQYVDDLCAFLAGNSDRYIRSLERGMREAAERQEYEEAGRLRDRWQALTRALERNTVVFDDQTDADVIALHDDDLHLAVQIFHVRAGRIVGERGLVIEKAEDLSRGEYLERTLQRIYDDPAVTMPAREVLVSDAPESREAVETWLSSLRGARVQVRVPQRGDKRALMETASENASNLLRQHLMKRASDLTARSQALQELQDALGLPEPPLRIECIDVSTLQGQDTVASLVVFEDGLPRKSDYRSFAIRTLGADDLTSVAEVVARRFTRVEDSSPEATDERQQAPAHDESGRSARSTPPASDELGRSARSTPPVSDASGRSARSTPPVSDASGPSARSTPPVPRFAYPPSLLVIDGGAPQVRAAQDALMAAGVGDLPVIGLAKRLEEVWLPGEGDPVILPRTSEALYLLQRIRDEAHRRAISLHRTRRGKRSTTSVLDSVPGLGEVKAKALRRHFGSLTRMKQATAEEIMTVPGFGPVLAEAVYAALHPGDSAGDAPDGP